MGTIARFGPWLSLVLSAVACDVGTSPDPDVETHPGSHLEERIASRGPRRAAFTATQSQELTGTGGAALALDGTTVAIGAPNINATGSVYVFVNSGGTWTQQGPALASGVTGDGFGTSVAVSGDILVVGAPYATVGANAKQGSAYVFARNGTTWTQQGGALTASDGVASDDFGYAVAVSGTTALLGAPGKMGTFSQQGAVYTFVQAGTSWGQQGTSFTDPQPEPIEGFGLAIAMRGATALVGAPNNTIYQQYVSVFEHNGTTWTRAATLTAPDYAHNDDYGSAVAFDGVTAVVGTSQKNGGVGEAYVYVDSGGVWAEEGPPLVPTVPYPGAETGFGSSVAVSGNTVLVGAPYTQGSVGADQGVAFVFVQSEGSWTRQAPPLAASDGTSYAGFGSAVALGGTTAIVGAGYVSGNNTYVFQLGGLSGATCSTPADCATPYQCNSGHCSPQCQVCTGTDPSTCTNLTGTACDDSDACTRTDTCQNGVCVGANPIICTAMDQCHLVGTCDPATGVCSNPSAQDGTTCSDGNPCTQTDQCMGGTCTGSNPVTCTMPSQCQVNGACDTTTGQCDYLPVTDGTPCTLGSACYQSASCQSGVCTGSNPVVCTPSDACHVAGTCQAQSGTCTNPIAPNGTACPGGDCENGACVDGGVPGDGGPDASAAEGGVNEAGAPDAGGTPDGGAGDAGGGMTKDATAADSGGGGGNGDAAAASDSGGSDATADASTEASSGGANSGANAGCSCRAAGTMNEGSGTGLFPMLAGAVGFGWFRRRRRGRRRSYCASPAPASGSRYTSSTLRLAPTDASSQVAPRSYS